MSLSNAEVAKVRFWRGYGSAPTSWRCPGQLNSIVDYVVSSRSLEQPGLSLWPTASVR